MTLLDEALASIRPPDPAIGAEVQARLDSLTKPPGSLGRLEEIAKGIAMIRGDARPLPGRKRIVLFAGDHGVAAEGVSAFPQEVTPQMVRNILAGGAAVNVLAEHAGAELVVVDAGVADPLEGAEGLVRRKVRAGTGNIAKGPAMTMEETIAAVEAGVELAFEAASDGVVLLGTGEMGIANTTPSAALLSVLLPAPVESVIGRGTGVDDAGLARKREAIEKALEANAGGLSTPLEALASVGGTEIAAICGLAIGAAARRVPLIVDGFISSAGALAACRLHPLVKEHLLFSHLSCEAGHRTFCERFDVSPLFDLDLRLGEGTGAALAMTLADASLKILDGMATFDSAQVSRADE